MLFANFFWMENSHGHMTVSINLHRWIRTYSVGFFLPTGVDGYVVFLFDDLGEDRPFTLLIEAEVVGSTETVTLTTVFRLRK